MEIIFLIYGIGIGMCLYEGWRACGEELFEEWPNIVEWDKRLLLAAIVISYSMCLSWLGVGYFYLKHKFYKHEEHSI